MNPLDKALKQAIADAIVDELVGGKLHVLDRRDLARRAALAGLKEMADLAARIVGEMAADHAKAKQWREAAVLHEAERQIRMLPDDVP